MTQTAENEKDRISIETIGVGIGTGNIKTGMEAIPFRGVVESWLYYDDPVIVLVSAIEIRQRLAHRWPRPTTPVTLQNPFTYRNVIECWLYHKEIAIQVCCARDLRRRLMMMWPRPLWIERSMKKRNGDDDKTHL